MIAALIFTLTPSKPKYWISVDNINISTSQIKNVLSQFDATMIGFLILCVWCERSL